MNVSLCSHRALNEMASLFGESATRVLVSIRSDNLTELLQRAASHGVPARAIGETGGNRLRVAVGGNVIVDVAVDDAERVWTQAIGRVYAHRAA